MVCRSLVTPRWTVGQVTHGDRCPASSAYVSNVEKCRRCLTRHDSGRQRQNSWTIRQGTSFSSKRMSFLIEPLIGNAVKLLQACLSFQGIGGVDSNAREIVLER